MKSELFTVKQTENRNLLIVAINFLPCRSQPRTGEDRFVPPTLERSDSE